MNKERRTKIGNIIKKLDAVLSDLKEVLFEEEMVFDNMPENLQCSMRGEESEEAIDLMNEAVESLQNACDNLDSI
jgi:hypothetical protein